MPPACNKGSQGSRLEVCISSAVAEVISRNPIEWVEAAKSLRDNVSKQRKGIGNLKAKLAAVANAKVEEAERIADILKREPNLDPDGEDKVFMTFKTRRIATLFKAKPEMLGYLKTRAQATSYNKGWRTKVKLYDEIAGDPEKIIAGAEILCKIDETQGSLVDGTKCTIRETLDAMDWYADNKHAAISAIFEEYKDVPTKEMFAREGDEGRPSR